MPATTIKQKQPMQNALKGPLAQKKTESETHKDSLLKDISFMSSYVYSTLKVGRKGSDTMMIPLEKWESRLMQHFAHRQLFYPLPGIQGGFGLDGPVFLAGGAPWAVPNVDPTAQAFFNTANDQSLFKKTSLQGRYNYYTDLINENIDIAVGPNSNKYLVGCFRPDMYNYPLLIISSAEALSGSPTVRSYDWTENPFFGCNSWVDSVRVYGKARQPDKDLEVVKAGVEGVFDTMMCNQDNLVYPGGHELEIEHINKTAYTNCAFKIRTSNNTIHDFIQLYEDITSDSINIGTTEGFRGSKSMYMATSGTRWGRIGAYADALGSFTTPDSTAAKTILQGCIANDWPVFQILATNSGPDTASISLNLMVRGWNAVAPLSQKFAGSMAFETVPFAMPAWPESCKTIGKVKGDQLGSTLLDSFSLTTSPALYQSVRSPAFVASLNKSPSARAKVEEAKSQPLIGAVSDSVVAGVKQGALKSIEEAAATAAKNVANYLKGKVSDYALTLFQDAKGVGRAALPLLEDALPLVVN